MTYAVDHHLTYIQTQDEITKQNAMDIADLTRTLRDSIRNFSLQQNRVEADLLDTLAALKKQARYSAAIREIEMAIVGLNFSRPPDASYWVYSLSVPQRVTVQCHEIGFPPTSKSSDQLLLEGTGILPNSSSCHKHAENFKLLPYSLGRTTFTLTNTHFVLPSIKNILHFSEENVLQPNAVHPVNLGLDEIVVRATAIGHTRGVEVNKIINALRDAEVRQQPIRWLWILGIVVVSLGCGSLWPVWLRLAN